jgi:hypothetical protein
MVLPTVVTHIGGCILFTTTFLLMLLLERVMMRSSIGPAYVSRLALVRLRQLLSILTLNLKMYTILPFKIGTTLTKELKFTIRTFASLVMSPFSMPRTGMSQVKHGAMLMSSTELLKTKKNLNATKMKFSTNLTRPSGSPRKAKRARRARNTTKAIAAAIETSPILS